MSTNLAKPKSLIGQEAGLREELRTWGMPAGLDPPLGERVRAQVWPSVASGRQLCEASLRRFREHTPTVFRTLSLLPRTSPSTSPEHPLQPDVADLTFMQTQKSVITKRFTLRNQPPPLTKIHPVALESRSPPKLKLRS